MFMQKQKKYKKQNLKDQNTKKSFDTIHRKSVQDNVNDKSQNESLGNIFIKYVAETEKESIFKKYI